MQILLPVLCRGDQVFLFKRLVRMAAVVISDYLQDFGYGFVGVWVVIGGLFQFGRSDDLR